MFCGHVGNSTSCNMGLFFTLVLFGMLLAFNLFAADTMIRMRSDVQIIRKALADTRKEATSFAAAPAVPAVPAAPAAPAGAKSGKAKAKATVIASPSGSSVASSGQSTPRASSSSAQQKGQKGVPAGGLKDALSVIKKLGRSSR